jgi:cellulose synthase/poly-beta-1,6-N-acetylglucosamine synthase-like glycosyltransferase
VTAAKITFWFCAAVIFYTYAGYPVVLWLRLRLVPRPWYAKRIHPRLSIVMAVRNEEQTLPRKLANITQLQYPAYLVEVIIVSDGSTDGTNQILNSPQPFVLKPVILPQSAGKAVALNAALEHATGEIVVFFDARQRIDRDALGALVAPFADPAVGCVSGELILETPDGASTDIGLYWRTERQIREWEAQTSSVPGATGAIYAVRRHLVPLIPAGTLLDDVYVPMSVIRRDYRAIHVREAIAYDTVYPDSNREFRRKVRTLTGVYQLVRLLPWTITPRNPIWFEFVSHKIMRLIAPFALMAAFASSVLCGGGAYRGAFVLQVLFYAVAVAGLFAGPKKLNKIARVASTFVLLNVAAMFAFRNALLAKKDVWA